MPSEKFEIIIAGGGISGAAIALFLSHLNTDITILESRPSRPTSAEGGILMLAPNGMHVLNGLDLAHKLLQRDSGIQVPCITINDSAGGLIGKVPHGSVERYGFASTMVMRWDIHEVLLDEVERKCLNVRWNAQVNATEEFDDGIIVHWTEHGLPKHKKVDLLIGADGIWSAARPSMFKCLGLSAPEPTYSGLVGMGTILDVDCIPGFSGFLSLERPCVMIHGRQGFVGMALFDKQGKKVGWWTTHEAADRSREEWRIPKEQAFREMRERYSGWAFPVPQLIAAAEASGDQPFIWPVFEIEKLGHWHSKRTVLIGDAAHAMPPHSGQGASQSLEDAGYLAYLLRQYLEKSSSTQGFDVEDLMSTLAAFQAGRQPRVDGIIDEANRRGSQKKEHSAVGQFMKKWMMKIVFLFMQESWSDGWFGYRVPGIEEWAALRASTST
ncbi:FAD/NAD(P)-binding domain-containing protein [Paxillus ammoniavirescens]|nr:FAD/NAD(P)-binding domain-containing protein [Paxillus ammoniavirescens]